MTLVDTISIKMGGTEIVHYENTVSAVLMNMLLKQNRYMIIGNGQDTDDIRAVAFPILFGAPYLIESMCLPYSASNKKTITLGLDIANSSFDDLLVSIHQVILPNAKPQGAIRQEEVNVSAQGTGLHDIKLQTNWDLLKLLFKIPTAPDDDAWTSTIEYAGFEIEDFFFGYREVEWEILHAELMDEMTGVAGIENHFHDDPSSGVTGYPEDLEHWLRNFGVMDFFFEKDLRWRAPISGKSSAKVKAYYGVDEAITYIQANYIPASKL